MSDGSLLSLFRPLVACGYPVYGNHAGRFKGRSPWSARDSRTGPERSRKLHPHDYGGIKEKSKVRTSRTAPLPSGAEAKARAMHSFPGVPEA